MIRSLKGMPDLLPEDTKNWREMERMIHEKMLSYGYEEIRTPYLEETSLFSRSIGESTDVVEKEMYTMETKGGESVTLRPEGTASVVRSFIENHLDQASDLLRLYYLGPMFRYERPQKGRLRQFHQLGIEAIGQEDPWTDVEVIAVAVKLLEDFSISPIKLEVNSVGDSKCRPAYREKLQNFLIKNKKELSEEASKRVDSNPLRVLDSKDPKNAETIQKAPKMLEHLCKDCESHFESVQKGLDTLEIPYEINNRIVRGLDYYTRTAFEISANHLGAQNAIMGGGRYDGLVEAMGGKPTPAVGFGLGLERLLLAAKDWKPTDDCEYIALLALGDKHKPKLLQIAERLRLADKKPRVEAILQKNSLKSGLRFANKRGASMVVILGDAENEKGVVQVKNLREQSQAEVPFEEVERILQ